MNPALDTRAADRPAIKPYYDHGGITIYHGDCRDILPALAWDVLISDVPYGIKASSGRNGRYGDCRIAGDDDTELRDWLLVQNGDRPALIFGSDRAPRPAGTKIRLIWDKGEHVGMGDLALPWKPNTEEIYVLGDGWRGRRRGSVLHHLAVAGTAYGRTWRWHPYEKPESLMVELLQCSPPGTVLDPCMGSGSTLVAAKKLGLRAIGIELDERWCDAAVKRLSQEVLPLGLSSDNDLT